MTLEEDLFEKIREEVKKSNFTRITCRDDVRRAAVVIDRVTKQFYNSKPWYQRIPYLFQRFCNSLADVFIPPEKR